MIIGIPRETAPNERRVAMVPAVMPTLTKAGLEVVIQAGAGDPADFPDREYLARDARIASSRQELFAAADVILQVRTPSANQAAGQNDLPLIRTGQTLIGLADPATPASRPMIDAVADRGAVLFALELMPRISRAQAMDVLSSQATVAGYKAVLLAAAALPRMFPLLMTAAGTVPAARVLVIGAGVAGLQAIATAKRLGAIVEAYDIRPAVREQVVSVGAKFVELPLETSAAESAGGYARAQSEDFYRRQRELLGQVIARSDVVICTASVPGKKSPVLVAAEMVRAMKPGSVIVDLAADRGGNCELTKPDQSAQDEASGVTILGPTNLAASVPKDASAMFARNVTTFLLHLLGKEKRFSLDADDEITRSTLVCRDGKVLVGS